jgi:hypothetical protein
MSQLRPSLLNGGKQALETVAEVVLEVAVGLRRGRVHKKRR